MVFEPIASATLRLERPGGATELRIEVHRPVRDPEGGWSCQVRMPEVDGELPPVRGEDSLQALALALELVRLRLADAAAAGATLRYPDSGEVVPLEAYFPGAG